MESIEHNLVEFSFRGYLKAAQLYYIEEALKLET